MQTQRPVLSQEQRLSMNPFLIQAIKLMELPVMDLRERIEEELERNPALELKEDRSTVSLEDATRAKPEEYDYFDTVSDTGFVSRGGEEAADRRQRFLEGALARPETLQDHLLWQFRIGWPLRPGSREESLSLGERLIQNLNSDGFHIVPVEELLEGEDPAEVERLAAFIQTLDPPGCCTGDYRESLRVQARLRPDAPPLAPAIVDHLEALAEHRWADVLQELGIRKENLDAPKQEAWQREIDTLKAACTWVSENLQPFPGRQFSSGGDVRYVVPDIKVTRRDEEFVIVLNDETIPVVGLSPFFMKLAREDAGGEKAGARGGREEPPEARQARDFARENLKEARWFIQTINDRNHTLLRVTRAIVEFQRPFFCDGPQYIAPLTQRDVALELDLSESTVSRTANGKFVQTDWGIYELRRFFTNSITGAGSAGSGYSKEGVKEVIRSIIAEDDRQMSDQEIVKKLARRGITLARRTVTKYRQELDLGSSYERRR